MTLGTKAAYLGIKYHPDHRNRERIALITDALAAVGYATTCITRDVEQWGTISFSPQELMARTFAVIEASKLCVIDLTEKGVGLGIEAGYAFAKGIPIVTVAQTGADISETLRGISQTVGFYQSLGDLVAFFAGNYMSLLHQEE